MNLLSETPWWLPTGLVFLGGILLVTGNRRMEKRLLYAGIGLGLLGILIGIVSYTLESPREQAMRATRQLLRAVQARQWAAFASLLHPQVSIVGWRGRSEMVEGAKRHVERYELRKITITGMRGEADGHRISVFIRVLAEFRDATPGLTSWKLEWEPTDDHWLLTEVEPLGGQSISVAAVEDYFRGMPR